ncbi:MAG: phage tail protein, partial [Proteobacteria bacterium]|nr:phage tail protein [Pseudomonadota bacterium]
MSTFTLDVTIYGDIDQIIKQMHGTEAQVKLASMRALNKTALWLKSQSVKEISTQKKLQQKIIRERLKLVKASKSSLKALVVASLYGIKASLLGSMRQTAIGAKAGKSQFTGAFVATMPTGHWGIFKRKREPQGFLSVKSYYRLSLLLLILLKAL